MKRVLLEKGVEDIIDRTTLEFNLSRDEVASLKSFCQKHNSPHQVNCNVVLEEFMKEFTRFELAEASDLILAFSQAIKKNTNLFQAFMIAEIMKRS